MKTLLKIVGGLVVLLLVVAACGYGYMMFAFPKVPPPTAIQDRGVAGAAGARQVPGRSRRLAARPATQRDWTKFSGPAKPDTLGAGGEKFILGPAGVVYSKNITPAAIGSWTDGELLRAVTQGVSKDGTPLFPLMPYPHFGAMAEEDIHAVLAYVRSLKAIEKRRSRRRRS